MRTRYKVADKDTVIRSYLAYLDEARSAREDRMDLNRRNRQMLFGLQDYSEKSTGQSTEFLPKTAGAVERLAAFIKLGLTSFGDWFAVELPPGNPVKPEVVEKLLKRQLDRIWGSDRKYHAFPVVVSDAVKQGMLESLMVVKVHVVPVTRPGVNPETLQTEDFEHAAMAIELLPTEGYYPDPTGRGLYEIHEGIRDLCDIQRLAKLGIYDKKVVDGITDSWTEDTDDEQNREQEERGQNESETPGFRKRVLFGELWGTLLNEKGEEVAYNCLTTVINRQHVVRAPERNPLWHGETPFVSAPLLRVPNSTWHRALMDDAVRLNQALNEVFNLTLDGALAAVWGVRQVRENFIKDPQSLTGGIPQNAAIVVTDDCPANVKVVEQIATGEVPREAMPMMELLEREFNDAAITNDLKLGQLSEGNQTATEITEASQSYSTILDSLIADLENEFMAPLLRKVWLSFLQHFDSFPAEDIVYAVGEEAATALSQMPPAERYKALGGVGFKVHGLSAVMARARMLQRLLALVNTVSSQPWLLQSFLQRYSPNKLIDLFLKHSNIDSQEIEADPEEIAQNQMQMQMMAPPPAQPPSPTPGTTEGFQPE